MNSIIIGSNHKIDGDVSNIVVRDSILTIVIKDSVELQLNFNGKNTYKKIEIIVEENGHLYLLDTKYQSNDKKYEYNVSLKDNSSLEWDKFYDTGELEETLNVSLEGFHSRIEVHNATISNQNQVYVQNMYHRNKDTNSHILNRGISGKGNIQFQVNTYVEKGSIQSVVNQNSKIMMLEANESKIEPNLFIDENDVNASHGASIGKFGEQELFYLQSRGLKEGESIQLLMQAFLLGGMKANAKNEIENIIQTKGGWKHE